MKVKVHFLALTYVKKFTYKCYNCKERGQKISECPKIEKNSKVLSAEDEVTVITGLSNVKVKNKVHWNAIQIIVDWWYTNHLFTSDLVAFLFNKKKVDHIIKVGEEGYSAPASFETSLQVCTEGLNIKLENVWLCKNLTHNLVSLKKVESRDMKIVFQNRNRQESWKEISICWICQFLENMEPIAKLLAQKNCLT